MKANICNQSLQITKKYTMELSFCHKLKLSLQSDRVNIFQNYII